MANQEQTRVISIKGVCEIFNCTRPTYYHKYANKLTPVPNIQGRILYKESDVLSLKKEEDNPEFKIVK
jgi:predicted DNA-binding transcriptional regulator AlpA